MKSSDLTFNNADFCFDISCGFQGPIENNETCTSYYNEGLNIKFGIMHLHNCTLLHDRDSIHNQTFIHLIVTQSNNLLRASRVAGRAGNNLPRIPKLIGIPKLRETRIEYGSLQTLGSVYGPTCKLRAFLQ